MANGSLSLAEVIRVYGVNGPLVRRRVARGLLTPRQDVRDFRRVLFDVDELDRVFGPAPRRTSGEAA